MDSINTSHREGRMQHLSESVYMGLNKIVGTPQQVAMRRDVVDIYNMFKYQLPKYETRMLCSGSYGEGFRLRGSDEDIMICPIDCRVIWDLSQIDMYNIDRVIPILAETSNSPPGFTLLSLPVAATIDLWKSSILMNGKLYVSSSKNNENMKSILLPNSTRHGPCNLTVMEGLEYDITSCFACDFWPPSAFSWINRCHSWPRHDVMHDIIKNGCHFVPIGHRLGNHEDIEWRISFSLAEQKLVYAMNHCEFSTYGLLKLFLNEVINKKVSDEHKLLCSYHMKTAIFWVLQQKLIIHWCPQNLLKCFWVCFKLILKWVFEGACPNFFIPENNMFLSKIHGDSQAMLFLQLFTLYKKGISCLLLSPSIRSFMWDVLCNPRLSIYIDEKAMISEAEFDVELFEEMHKNAFISGVGLKSVMNTLYKIEQMRGFSLTKYQVVVLQYSFTVTLHEAAFLSYKMNTSSRLHNFNNNKVIYISVKRSSHMLKMAAVFGCISDMLYLAMHYYQTCRYTEALAVIQMTKCKLAQPYIIHGFHVDIGKYTEALGGRSLPTKLKQAVAKKFKLSKETVYISELVTEQQCAGWGSLMIPPFVMLHMLEFLCYRHIDTVSAQIAINDLLVLVQYDRGELIDFYVRDISWQILGICQQINGDFQAALNSYQQSLRQYPFHKLHNATAKRLQSI